MYINHWDLELLVNQTEKYNELRRFYGICDKCRAMKSILGFHEKIGAL